MTDDEFERTLFDLALEEPPADLHERILAATIARPRLTFRAWEIRLVGTLFAFMVWLPFVVGTPVAVAAESSAARSAPVWTMPSRLYRLTRSCGWRSACRSSCGSPN